MSSKVEAVISDFGGVLTSPLAGSFDAFYEYSGVSPEQLGNAIAAVAERLGANPLFELETGRLSETEFLTRSPISSPSSPAGRWRWRASASATSPTSTPTTC